MRNYRLPLVLVSTVILAGFVMTASASPNYEKQGYYNNGHWYTGYKGGCCQRGGCYNHVKCGKKVHHKTTVHHHGKVTKVSTTTAN